MCRFIGSLFLSPCVRHAPHHCRSLLSSCQPPPRTLSVIAAIALALGGRRAERSCQHPSLRWRGFRTGTSATNGSFGSVRKALPCSNSIGHAFLATRLNDPRHKQTQHKRHAHGLDGVRTVVVGGYPSGIFPSTACCTMMYVSATWASISAASVSSSAKSAASRGWTHHSERRLMIRLAQ